MTLPHTRYSARFPPSFFSFPLPPASGLHPKFKRLCCNVAYQKWKNGKWKSSITNYFFFLLQPTLLSSPSPPFLPLLALLFVLHMLWWLLLWAGEMIQADGMHDRPAAGHGTCNSKKKSGRVHVWEPFPCTCLCVNWAFISACAKCFCNTSNSYSFLNNFSVSRLSGLFVFMSFPPFFWNAGCVKQIKPMWHGV